jgi:hypothetical protein
MIAAITIRETIVVATFVFEVLPLLIIISLIGSRYLAELKNLETNPKDGICLYPYNNDKVSSGYSCRNFHSSDSLSANSLQLPRASLDF